MDSPGKSVKGKIPVQAPINNKPEKEEKKEEDGFSMQLYLKKNQENQVCKREFLLFTFLSN